MRTMSFKKAWEKLNYPARTVLESLSNRGISRKLSSRAQIKAAKAAGQITHAHDPRHKQKPAVEGSDNRVTTLAENDISRDLSSRVAEDRQSLGPVCMSLNRCRLTSSRSAIQSCASSSAGFSVGHFRLNIVGLSAGSSTTTL